MCEYVAAGFSALHSTQSFFLIERFICPQCVIGATLIASLGLEIGIGLSDLHSSMEDKRSYRKIVWKLHIYTTFGTRKCSNPHFSIGYLFETNKETIIL